MEEGPEQAGAQLSARLILSVRIRFYSCGSSVPSR